MTLYLLEGVNFMSHNTQNLQSQAVTHLGGGARGYNTYKKNNLL